ncbi:hypothetical protein [Anaerotignum propionicum]|uniref:hypothetical protein n=1 Tax=Anaerotignum propionicum TaxID=28446 RepID=UPI00289822B9|nr:hypothetical protein [Anaerotignum propionicum]
MYLSTKMTDIKGNYRYLTELEGVKKNRELFYQYCFKELKLCIWQKQKAEIE